MDQQDLNRQEAKKGAGAPASLQPEQSAQQRALGPAPVMKYRRAIRQASLAVLTLGMISAGAIYFTAVDAPDDPLRYIMVDGVSYAVAPEYSKKYVHDLERIGGKANVLAARFDDWFGSLWHGKPLAYTVGWISIGVAFALYQFAKSPAPAAPARPARPTAPPPERPGS